VSPAIQRVAAAGPRAIIVDVESSGHARALSAHLVEHPAAGQIDLVAGERSVLLLLERGGLVEAAVDDIGAIRDLAPRADEGRLIELPTAYDGEDLAPLADSLGMSAEAVVRWHSEQSWTAAFSGFTPGFAYLEAGAQVLPVPRRAVPRTIVPPGSVAVADRFSGVYPRASPGGWQLIGRTSAVMWNSDRNPPALVAPGDRVRFVAVRDETHLPAPAEVDDPTAPTPEDEIGTSRAVEVIDPGLQTLVQDRGRRGLQHRSVSTSGAADAYSYLAGNELVGNAPDAAALEIAYGGAEFVARGQLVLALTGADVEARITSVRGANKAAPLWAPFVVDDGTRLELGAPTAGIRTYLCVRGGILASPELGSRSTDILAGLGPRPARRGDLYAIGHAHGGPVGRRVPPAEMPNATTVTPLEIDPGPRAHLFTPTSRRLLLESRWTITGDANRVGVRLEGESPLTLTRPRELPSEGIMPGSIQVPPSGMPMVFLRDHPATGGYPLIGIVRSAALNRLAQLPPGSAVQFVLGGD